VIFNPGGFSGAGAGGSGFEAGTEGTLFVESVGTELLGTEGVIFVDCAPT
jgi:hypothetical protein